jgi:hypothetical protein
MDEANDALLRLAMLDLGECGGKPAAKNRDPASGSISGESMVRQESQDQSDNSRC